MENKTYALALLAKELNFNVSRLKSICKALKIDIISFGSQTCISVEAVDILKKAVLEKKSGKTISYETSSTIEPIKPEKSKSNPPQPASTAELVVREQSTSTATPEEFFAELVKAVGKAQQPAPEQSPLAIQRELMDAVKMGFLLGSEQVANIFGMKKSSITSWKDGHKKYGFQFHKVKEGVNTLWKVSQY